jgi:hypothetical protein
MVMKTFRMEDVEKIETMLAVGKTVEVEWKDGATGDMNTEIVKSVRWDGLVFTTGGCVYTGIDKLVEIREVA